MSDTYGANPGDTLEFLAIMNAAGSAPTTPAPDASDPLDDFDFLSAAPAPSGRKSSGRDVRTVIPGTAAAPAPEEPKPVVIKGGPRRVVRADGRQPEMSQALGQQRFSLSSGRAMFAPKKRRNVLRETVFALVALLLVAAVFAVAWTVADASLTKDKQESFVGTTDYDGSLSLTPANDGGYYTVFLITSTPTDEEQVGTLSQVVMHRTDKAVTTSTKVYVPANLYVEPTSSSTTARTVAQLLEEQSVTRALNGIDNELGIRLYNVVVCDQDVYADYESVMSGAVDPSALDAQSYLGRVRSNLTLDGIVEFCGKIGDLDQDGIRQFTVPTIDLDVQGTIMAQATEASYNAALVSALSTPANVQYDDRGNYAGTSYDEWGNPIVDANGVPLGALYDPNTGNLVFDENGYLQFYGQQYDANGWPVGTKYYEDGVTPILDEWGNPAGTQYNWDGSDYQYDWRGNIIIL